MSRETKKKMKNSGEEQGGHIPKVISLTNGEPSIFLLPIFFATQIIGGAKELVVLL